jgi:hypothetical protein
MTDPKSECEDLLNRIMPFAEQNLTKYGTFMPIGLALEVGGKIAQVMAYLDESAHPNDLVQIIKDAFIEGARSGKYKATALAYDVRVPLPGSGHKSDAIAVHLDHRDRPSKEVFFPYRLEGEKLTIDSPFAQRGLGEIFPSQ